MLAPGYEPRTHTYLHNRKPWERGYSEDKLLSRFAYGPRLKPLNNNGLLTYMLSPEWVAIPNAMFTLTSRSKPPNNGILILIDNIIRADSYPEYNAHSCI